MTINVKMQSDALFPSKYTATLITNIAITSSLHRLLKTKFFYFYIFFSNSNIFLYCLILSHFYAAI